MSMDICEDNETALEFVRTLLANGVTLHHLSALRRQPRNIVYVVRAITSAAEGTEGFESSPVEVKR